jgi:hypothetical protein
MILSATTDKLSLITDFAGDIDVVVTYIDRNQSTGAIGAANRQLTTITTATTTDILAAPAATTDRKVESITIRNAHVSTSNDVIVQYNANGTLYELHAARLRSTEMLQWSEHDGFEKITDLDLPYFFRGLTHGLSRATSAVSGNDITISYCRGTSCVIKPTKANTAVRTIGCFSMFTYYTIITTTGIAIGLLLPEPGFSSAINDSLISNTRSVPGSTVSVMSTATVAGTDQLSAHGTAQTSSTNRNLGILAAHCKYTESNSPSFTAWLGIQSEVGGSEVDLAKGASFEVFEADN